MFYRNSFLTRVPHFAFFTVSVFLFHFFFDDQGYQQPAEETPLVWIYVMLHVVKITV
jgi:hypothetical protein